MQSNNAWVLTKFCVYKLKMLVSDEHLRPKYMAATDAILYEFYGVKKFTEKLSDSCTDQEFARQINRIGLDALLSLLKNSRYYNALRDLVVARTEISSIRRKLRRQKGKGVVDKDLIKEYNYLTKIYNRGIKILRKMLGLKSYKKAYKRKFNAVKNLMNDYGGWSDGWGDYAFSSFGAHGRDPYDSYGEDDYDDYPDDSSELQDFLKMMNGTTEYMGGRSRPKNPMADPYDEDFDDEWGEYHMGVPFGMSSQSDQEESDIERRINGIYNKLASIEDIVDAYATQANYDVLHHRNPITHRPEMDEPPMEYIPGVTKLPMQGDASDTAIQQQMNQVLSAVGNLTQAMSGFEKWREELDDLLFGEDTVDVQMGAPEITEVPENTPAQELYDKVTNKHPDVYTEAIPEDPELMNREELIDEINNSPVRTITPVVVKEEN